MLVSGRLTYIGNALLMLSCFKLILQEQLLFICIFFVAITI